MARVPSVSTVCLRLENMCGAPAPPNKSWTDLLKVRPLPLQKPSSDSVQPLLSPTLRVALAAVLISDGASVSVIGPNVPLTGESTLQCLWKRHPDKGNCRLARRLPECVATRPWLICDVERKEVESLEPGGRFL